MLTTKILKKHKIITVIMYGRYYRLMRYQIMADTVLNIKLNLLK